MKIVFGLYRVLLAAILTVSIFGVAASAASSGFYLNLQQNVSVETGQYYTLIAQAGSPVVSFAPYTPPVLYNYQWYNATGGQMIKIRGDNSTMFAGISGSQGVYTYVVVATNEQGVSMSNSTTLTVTSVPSISISSSGRLTLDQGQDYEFNSTYLPGAGNATYGWAVGGLGVVSHCTSASPKCRVSTANAAAGLYKVSLQVKDGTEQSYLTAPVDAKALVTVNSAPVVTAAPIANAIRGGNATYTVTVVNGTGPFNISLYTTNGMLVGSRSLQMPNQTGLLVFNAPILTTSYYAAAKDLGVAGVPYTFNSMVSTLTTSAKVPPSSSAVNSVLIGIIVVLVLAILVVSIRVTGRNG